MKKNREPKKLNLSKIEISKLNINSLSKIMGGGQSELDPERPGCGGSLPNC